MADIGQGQGRGACLAQRIGDGAADTAGADDQCTFALGIEPLLATGIEEAFAVDVVADQATVSLAAESPTAHREAETAKAHRG